MAARRATSRSSPTATAAGPQARAPPIEGHRAGADTVKARLRDAVELGIEELTVYSFSTENWSRPRRGGHGAHADVRRAHPRRDARAARAGRPDALHRPPRGRLRRRLSSRWTGRRSRPRRNERITLFVAFNYGGRAEILDAARALRRRRRGRVPRAALRAGDARPRPDDPHQRRAAALQLPALAVGLLRAGVPRRALARLRPRGVRGLAGRVRRAPHGASAAADGRPLRPSRRREPRSRRQAARRRRRNTARTSARGSWRHSRWR